MEEKKMNPEAKMILEELDELSTKINNISRNINNKLFINTEPGSCAQKNYDIIETK